MIMVIEVAEQEESQGFGWTIQEMVDAVELGKHLSQDRINRISELCKKQFAADRDTMQGWLQKAKRAMEMAMQIKANRQGPWPNSSNMQYPMVAQACIQFNATAMPQFIKSDQIAHPKVIGRVSENALGRAVRVAQHINFQAMHGISGWVENFDSMLMVLPCIGHVYKKSSFDPVEKAIIDQMVMPQFVTLDNKNTKNLDDAVSVSHQYCLPVNEIRKRERLGQFMEGSLDKMLGQDRDKDLDEFKLIKMVEQCCWLDLDEDDIFEPYIVYMYEDDWSVAAIEPRYDDSTVWVSDSDGDVLSIKPRKMWTDYRFIPPMDGTYLHVGFGHILGPVNAGVNSLFNALMDAGKINNMPSGYVSRALQQGDTPLRTKPGMYRPVNASPEQIASGFFTIPTKEPSNVLYQLMLTLLEQGRVMSATQDIMSGGGEMKDIPATTVLALIEQGMKVMTAIFKRIYRSMTQEFGIWYGYMRDFMVDDDEEESISMIGADGVQFELKAGDYKGDMNVCPVADPNMATQIQMLAKARALLDLREINPAKVDEDVIMNYYVQALQINDLAVSDIVLKDVPPAVAQEMQRNNDLLEQQLDQEEANIKLRTMEVVSKVRLDATTGIKNLAQAEGEEVGMQMQEYQAQMQLLERRVLALGGMEEEIAGGADAGTEDAGVQQGAEGMDGQSDNQGDAGDLGQGGADDELSGDNSAAGPGGPAANGGASGQPGGASEG